MKNSTGIWKKAFVLTLVGGLGFWLANFAISRTAIAAEYRAAMSISRFLPLLQKSKKRILKMEIALQTLKQKKRLLPFFLSAACRGHDPNRTHP